MGPCHRCEAPWCLCGRDLRVYLESWGVAQSKPSKAGKGKGYLSHLGIGHEFTLLWYHLYQLSNRLSILLSSQGVHRVPKGSISWTWWGLGGKAMTVAFFRSWSGATLVLSLHVLNPQPCWVLKPSPASHLHGHQGFPSHPLPPTLQASWGPTHCGVQCSTLLCLEPYRPESAKS